MADDIQTILRIDDSIVFHKSDDGRNIFLRCSHLAPLRAGPANEALNFGITMILLYVVLAVSIVGWFLFWVPPIIWTVMRIYAAYKASLGEFYRYPLIVRLVK